MEREGERADMTAHLHDGVLQTLALIQLHADDPADGVFARTLAGTRIGVNGCIRNAPRLTVP